MTNEQKIIELYRKENEAMVNKDITTLNEILAPTMELTHMTGYVQPKMEWIDQIQNEEMKYYSSKEDVIEDIQINGNQASLIGKNQVKASIWGSSISTWRLQMKMYFARENGKWFIIKQVASIY
ncbi:nuclear transport factor 2 family protein [Lactobacillus sp. LL6]|uniref:nuclear transport factor 2 family protein n=1 Tax=Lactobacillus sp. LL6 TaxID=2596827 RepID=UPI0011851DC7|nr:nuclear transport factor 2 family protein [Lactobacillus sp. LL6]TSO26390.1 nuclear transport factor 2 family protein [Lactobacillus sp. LL6]